MFFDCKNISELNLSSFKTNNVTDIGRMFLNCYNLFKLSLLPFNTNKVTNREVEIYQN